MTVSLLGLYWCKISIRKTEWLLKTNLMQYRIYWMQCSHQGLQYSLQLDHFANKWNSTCHILRTTTKEIGMAKELK